MNKEKSIQAVWRWRLNGEWDTASRKLLFANIATVFSYSYEDVYEMEMRAMEKSIKHLVESLCQKNGFANPYEQPYYHFEYDKRAMALKDEDFFDWKWNYAINKMILTRGEDDLSRLLYSRLVSMMEQNNLSLSFYFGYYYADEGCEYEYNLLPVEECDAKELLFRKRIDVKPENDTLIVGPIQDVSDEEFFSDISNDIDILIRKPELKEYLKEIADTDIMHNDINLIREGIKTKELIINDDFSICVPEDCDYDESTIYKNSEDGIPEWKIEFIKLDPTDNVPMDADAFAAEDIISQIPDYNKEIAEDSTIDTGGLESYLMQLPDMHENTYYVLHSFPVYKTKQVEISFSDAMAFDSKINRCYRGAMTVLSDNNPSFYKLIISGSRVTRSADVLDLFGDMFKRVRSKVCLTDSNDKHKPRTVRYISCAFNYAMDVPGTNFNASVKI